MIPYSSSLPVVKTAVQTRVRGPARGLAVSGSRAEMIREERPKLPLFCKDFFGG